MYGKYMNGNTDSEDAVKSAEYIKAMDYFMPKKGLSNDFIFPASLLDELTDPKERETIEKLIIHSCLHGDKRYYDALSNIRFFDLSARFTGLAVKTESDPHERSSLMKILYMKTHNPVYMKNLVFMAPSAPSAAYFLSRIFEEQDWWDASTPESDEYSFLFSAMCSIIDMHSGTYRNSGLELYKLKDNVFPLRSLKVFPRAGTGQAAIMLDVGEWKFKGYDFFLSFWKALICRLDYIRTGNTENIRFIVRESVMHPEVYDILSYMLKNGETNRETVLEFIR